jgi:hypothetical protein
MMNIHSLARAANTSRKVRIQALWCVRLMAKSAGVARMDEHQD